MCNLVSAKPVERPSLETMLGRIDQSINDFGKYVAKRESRIKALKIKLRSARTDLQRYKINKDIAWEYRPMENDSAIAYLRTCANIAKRMGNMPLWGEALALRSIRCSKNGMFDEARSLLDSIPSEVGVRIPGVSYYYAYYNLYDQLAINTYLPDLKVQYRDIASRWFGPAIDHARKGSQLWYLFIETDNLNRHDLKGSMAINNMWIKHTEKFSHSYALAAMYRYLEFKAISDSTEMMYWLTISVLSDLRNGVMDSGSMWELANQMMLEGDIDRAHKYIFFLNECNNRFASRMRQWQITPLMSEIATIYKAKSDRNLRNTRMALLGIALLLVIVFGMFVFVSRQRHQLAQTRDNLAVANNKLNEVNDELKNLNEKLRDSNDTLSSTNSQLREANQVKEEYVARFMSLCTLYIDRLDNMRKHVNRLVKAHRYNDLYEQSRNQEEINKEKDAFYSYFDSAFLNLFPNFVDEFNTLLVPEYQVTLDKEGQMPTMLRVYALMRLGITESKKIAEFLHYSVNTIYNYRTKMKKGAVGDPAEFENEVIHISTSHSNMQEQSD